MLFFLSLQCSVKCGKGIKTRTVFCGSWQDGKAIKVDDELCSENEKMHLQEECHGKECHASWFTGPWTRVWNKYKLTNYPLGEMFVGIFPHSNEEVLCDFK